MARLLSSAVFAFLIVVISTFGAGAALTERRVALVIGNSLYKNQNISLANPRNDAEDVAAVLKSLGFEVVQASDAGKREVDLALQRFARLATSADSALFYYAGHAMQYQGRNYLMPVDAELEDEVSLRYNMVPIEDVRAALDRASGVKIMILDACRNNPLADRFTRTLAGQTRALMNTRGLARIDKTQGMVVAYATAADDVAADGNNARNSPFTAALVRRMQEPGLEIEMMFRRIASDVNANTGGRQRPETYISLLSEYYLNQSDRLVWERLRDSGDIVAIREFITRFPYSVHAWDAKYRLDILERSAREREQQARLQREREIAEREAAQRREIEERLKKLEAERRQDESTAAQREAERRREAAERLARAETERQQAERERAERTEREAARQREEAERLARIESERTRIAQEEAERQAAQRRAEAERLARAEAEQRLREQAFQRLAAEQLAKAEAERLLQKQQDSAEMDAARRRQFADRQRAERDEAERKAAAQRAEAERLAKIEADRLEAIRQSEEAARKREAAQRLAALEAERTQTQREAREREATARREAEERQKVERNCQRERTAFGPIESDLAKLQAFVKQSTCDEIRALATDRIAAINSQHEVEAQACKREDEQLALLQAAGANKERVGEFQRQMTCERLRPTVVAILSKPDAAFTLTSAPPGDAAAPAQASPRDLIRNTQVELRRIGCFSGADNGEMSEATRAAVKRYLSQTDRDEDDLRITPELLLEIRGRPPGTCPLICPTGQIARGQICVVDRAKSIRVERPRPPRNVAREQAPRPARAERPAAPAPAIRVEAARPSSGGGGSPRAIGIGF